MAVKEPAPEVPAPKRKSKLKIIIIILVLIVVLIGGAVSFWWFQLREPVAPVFSNGTTAQPAGALAEGAGVSAGSASAAATDIPRATVNLVALPTVMVNLSDAAGDRYLTVGMEVEVSSPEAIQEIQRQNAKIRDSIIILLSSKTYADLASAEGKMQLKNEVAARLNQILGTPRVVRIYFTQFVVQ